MQGWRLKMEDAHIVHDFDSQSNHLLLPIFDGHAGVGSANFAAQNMMQTIETTTQWQQYINEGASSIELLEEALVSAFVEIDIKIREHQENSEVDKSGCTAVVAVVTPKYIICANAGDSRCVMSADSVAKPLSFDHKPNNDAELKRILAAGGNVKWNRVDGDLAVSRAFGK